VAEPKFTDHPDKLPVIFDFGKFGRETGRNDGNHFFVFGENLLYVTFGLQENFGALAANNGAVAAADAPFVDDLSLATDNFDGLYRTFPYAGKTNPAFVFNGKNQLFTFGVAHLFLFILQLLITFE
jgi:hypothetical protein